MTRRTAKPPNPREGCFSCNRAYWSTFTCDACLKKRRGRRARCAICRGNDNIPRLCATHRADPANAGWLERDEAPTSNSVDTLVPACRLAELHGARAAREVTEREKTILRLSTFGTEERVPYTDKAGRRRGSYGRRRALSLREIAKEAGCSPSWAWKVIERARRG